ncbi:hypothetical protein [Nocardia sp. CDC160]|uniref:hypothetical protein n=1 Tax=Nocardia sp. CDC160 TaxID=3112166 RepID=UPI002DB64BF6|nr:hypothetical protein [Nocardia sp. CDC160]MEC3920215.1 hypothetical protein [Nocardia sp. CDC160]
MASTPITTVDPAFMQTTASKTQSHHGEIGAHLRALSGCRDEFRAAVQGYTGDSVQAAFENAEVAGNSVMAFLQDIIQKLQAAGISYDANAQEAAGQINAANLDAAPDVQHLHAAEQTLIDNHSW